MGEEYRKKTQDEIDLDIGAEAYQRRDYETAIKFYRKSADAVMW